MSNKYTEKRKVSNLRYRSKLSKAEVWLTPEEKEILKKKAEAENKSLSGLFRNAVGLKDTPLQKEDADEH